MFIDHRFSRPMTYLFSGTSLLWLIKSSFFKDAAGLKVRDGQDSGLHVMVSGKLRLGFIGGGECIYTIGWRLWIWPGSVGSDTFGSDVLSMVTITKSRPVEWSSSCDSVSSSMVPGSVWDVAEESRATASKASWSWSGDIIVLVCNGRCEETAVSRKLEIGRRGKYSFLRGR